MKRDDINLPDSFYTNPPQQNNKNDYDYDDDEVDDDDGDDMETDDYDYSTQSTTSTTRHSSANSNDINEQRRRAKEWINARRSSAPTAQKASSTTKQTGNSKKTRQSGQGTSIEAAKLAAQQKIQSRIVSKVSHIDLTQPDEDNNSNTKSGRRSSTGRR